MGTTGYYFEEVTYCEMCGDPAGGHRVLGQRLNGSVGYSPRKRTGITVTVKKCRKCGLAYASPQPVPLDFQQHYGIPPESYWKDHYFEWTPSYFSAEIRELKSLIEIKPGTKALDIGAGIGKCMISLQHAGFDAYGLEPSASFHERAVTRMNIPADKLKLGTVEDLDYPAETFDFITFGAVFEHLYHPAACLEKALRWLKPEGVIHIEVPSSAYLVSKIFNTYYRLRGTNYVTNLSPMHTPFHMYEFGLKSFRLLAERSGHFTVTHHQYHVCDIFHLPRILHFPLRKIMQWTDTGMQLTVWIRKKGNG